MAGVIGHSLKFINDSKKAGYQFEISIFMAETQAREYFIQGITEEGKKFRPSDWAERLCGVLSSFVPSGRGPNARLKYSYYVRPMVMGDVKCVVVDEELKQIEPMAFDFVMNFARDNGLLITQACSLPDANINSGDE